MIPTRLTSKFPLYIVLLELTEQLWARGIRLDLLWQRLEFNEAADRLTNSEFGDFDERLCIVPDMAALQWRVRPALLDKATTMHHEQVLAEGQSNLVSMHRPRKTEPLRRRDSW